MAKKSEPAETPVYAYERRGFSLKVYQNRIDIVSRSGLMSYWTGGKRESILLRSIASVAAEGLTKLSITTNDGKKQTYMLGKHSEAARQAVVALL